MIAVRVSSPSDTDVARRSTVKPRDGLSEACWFEVPRYRATTVCGPAFPGARVACASPCASTALSAARTPSTKNSTWPVGAAPPVTVTRDDASIDAPPTVLELRSRLSEVAVGTTLGLMCTVVSEKPVSAVPFPSYWVRITQLPGLDAANSLRSTLTVARLPG